MAFLPTGNKIENLYYTINGVYGGEAYEEGFIPIAEMTQECSDAIENDDIIHMRTCEYRNPPGTNPQIVWGDWFALISGAGDTGRFNDSDFLADYCENVNDLFMLHSHDLGDRIGFGFKLVEISGDAKVFHAVFRLSGLDYEIMGQPLTAGKDSYDRTREFYWGLFTDRNARQAIPFWVISAHDVPVSEGDSANLYLPYVSGSQLQNILEWMHVLFVDEIIPPEPSDDPYYPGGTSEPSGTPTGTYDDTSDVIDLPTIPGFNLAANSILNVYSPDTSDLTLLGNYLWSNFDLTDPTKTLSKIFTNPLDYILSLHVLPFKVSTSTAQTVTLGGFATTVSMKPINAQFVDVDCGSLDVEEYWGNYLDYTYTSITLCLPYVGQVELDPDEVMGKTLKLKYRCDVITGAFVCFLYVSGEKVLGEYSGNCSMQMPVSAADYSRLNAAVLGVAATAASGFAGAIAKGAGAAAAMAGSLVSTVQGAKMGVQHSGGLTGAPGFMGTQKPYVIIHRPRQSVPASYNTFAGYPSNVTMKLSDCTGFTSVRQIILDGVPFTLAELEELEGILKGGVII